MIKPFVLADEIREVYPTLNDAQLESLSHTEGPLLIVAGPGSGKTLVLAIRTLNILMQELAEPNEILLCTFTEKSAFELRERVSSAAKKVGYKKDLSELRISTIHGMCNEYLMRYRHRTPLGNNFEVLDDLTQLLFIFENFGEIVGQESNGQYLTRWKTKWTAIEGARDYFNKIAEELVDPNQLLQQDDPFLQAIGQAYIAYEKISFDKNRIDFAHLQKVFYNLLGKSDISSALQQKTKYIMVDEYQDTNYIQEQILLRLAEPKNNLCVVGDEDQALYRFRGATVRNILEFESHFESCKKVRLTINYRSHENIIAAYNKFMESCDWRNPKAKFNFRHEKVIVSDPQETYPEYPAVFSVWGASKGDEANRLAELILFLKENKVIEDFSQVAILLHSVRLEHSSHYLAALESKGIPTFCPRARGYFETEEVKYMVACFAILFGFFGESRGEIAGEALEDLADYVDSCLSLLGKDYADPHPLAKCLQIFRAEVDSLQEGQSLDRRLGDYFYHFISHEPFFTIVRNENRARNIAIFSQLLGVFQNYYHYSVISHKNREYIKRHFFNSFLRLLYLGGINEYEDRDQPFPKGHVQTMTIHQSKGLEFPVIIVNSLDKQMGSPKDVDRHLGKFYHRALFEPENRITEFDRMRLHYVAFSRAEKMLVLTTTEQPKPYFAAIWDGLPQWPYVRKDLLKSLSFRLRNRMAIKKSFSFTSDLKVYETCPRQYQYFREYEFTPSRSAEIFFGALVHQTIEDIHRMVLDGKLDQINDAKIREMFEFNFRSLVAAGIRPIGDTQKENAFKQVINYFSQNRPQMNRIIETEVDVSSEKEDYILTGKIDLLMGDDNKLELLDFKSQPRPEEDDVRLDSYYKQLCIYAHILERRYGKRPDRLLLYWTGEPKREDALMEFPYRPELVDEAGRHFDHVVMQILNKEFKIKKPPEKKVCKECDFRIYCGREGVIKIKEIEEEMV